MPLTAPSGTGPCGPSAMNAAGPVPCWCMSRVAGRCGWKGSPAPAESPCRSALGPRPASSVSTRRIACSTRRDVRAKRAEANGSASPGMKPSTQWRRSSPKPRKPTAPSRSVLLRDLRAHADYVSRLGNVFGTPNVTSIDNTCYIPSASGRLITYGFDGSPDLAGGPACLLCWGNSADPLLQRRRQAHRGQHP